MQPILPITKRKNAFRNSGIIQFCRSRKSFIDLNLKTIVLCMLAISCAMSVKAQVSSYTYAATTGTYSQLSGAGITTTTTLTNGNADDGNIVITLPFPFTYNKIEYTQVTACTNGWVAMGSTANTNAANTDLFTTTAPTNAIAGWWGNLNLNTGNSGAFRHGLTATNVYTIQFDQLSGAASGSTSSTLKVRFQVSLYGPNSSNPGAVEILYGAATGAIQTGRTLGIKSVTSSVVSYKNGLNGSSSNTSTASSYPATGTLYRFTPPAVAYQAQFISMSTGATTWCSSETRSVTVTVKNIGTSSWTTAGAGMNVGLKWSEDADYGGAPSNIPRQSVAAGSPSGNVAPGATVTYTFPNVPSSQVAGTNHLIFDIVREGDCWFGNNTGTCGPGNDAYTSAAQTITLLPTATAGTAVNTCSNSSAVNITAGSSASNNASVQWSTPNGTGTFANATSLTTATYTPSAADIAAGSVTLTLTALPNSPCAANATSNKTLTINPAPTANAGSVISTCSTSGAVNITTGSSFTNSSSIAWSTTNGTGSFANSTSPTLATYAPSTADATAGTRNLVLTVNGLTGCNPATSNKAINITSAPTANAGSAINTCSNSGAVNITTGSTSTNNSGITWSTPNGTGTFANANSLTLATYTPSAADITAGSVTITLTATPNAPCAANATSNKTLTINTLPTAVAGNAILTCSNSGAVNITSGASATNQQSITWTSTNGTGSFASSTSLSNATYNPSAADITAGSRTLRLTAVGKAGCSNVTDDKLITITQAPSAVAGTAIVTCANSGAVSITAGSSASNNSSVTWSSSGSGTFANANSLTLATYDPSTADILAGSVTLTLTAAGNSPCGNATSNKSFTIRPIPTTTGVTICQGTTSQALTSSYTCAQTGTQTAGPNLPGAAATSGTGGAWSNPTNVLTNNASNATITINSFGSPTVSQSLNVTGFNFGLTIPANATITAIAVNIERNRSGGSFGEIRDNSVRLLKAGAATGDNDGATGTNWPTGVTVASYNGSTNALWGTTWTAAQVNASDFGVALIVDGSNSVGRVANVDYIDITVSYTVPGTLNWYTVSSGGTPIGSGSSFNPVGVLNSGLPNTSTAGTTVFYAECSTVTGCRTPTNYVITAAPAAPVSGGDQTVCSNGNPNQTLTATATGGTITWYNAANNGSVVTPTQVGVGTHTYYAQAFDGTCNSLTRTAVTLTINPVPVVSSGNQTVCSDGTLTQTLTATATGGTITWYDAAVGGNIVTNPVQIGVGSSTYYAEAFDGTCTSLSRAASVLTINPVPNAPLSGGDQTVCSNGNPNQTLTATATGGTITWYNAAVGGSIVTPAQVGVGTSTYYAQASDGTCSSLSRTAVTLTILAAPVAVPGGNQTVCSDGTLTQTLTASATGGTITWYDAAVGGNVVTTPAQTGVGSVTYYAEAFDGTCTSVSRAAVTLTINPVPNAPVSGGDQTACENGNPNQTLTASATGGTITWYDAAAGGNIVTPTQTGVGTSTYYAQAFDGTCSSLTRTAVTLTILAAPAAPVSGGNQIVCEDGNPNQTLTATATGGTITWYDAAAGGNIVTPSQVGVGTATYYAESYDGTCSSLTRTAVTLTITAAPIPAGTNQTVCSDGNPNQTLTANATGGTITWYDAAVGGNVVANPTQAGVGSSTYYAEAFDGCTSLTRAAVTLTINPVPNAPVSGGDQAVCSDGTLTQTLTATATGGTITWYNAAVGGSIVTPAQVGVGTSTYYAEASDGTCSSLTRTAVTLTINPVPNAPISGGNQTVCSDGTLTQTLTATATGGTITWYDAATNGNVVTPTQTGVGTVTYYAEASDGTCSSLTRTAVTLTINPVPNAPVSGGDQTVCEDGNPNQALTAIATGGTITWYDAATGGNVVTPVQTGVGTSTFYAEASDGTCSSLARTAVTLTINAAPAAPAVSNQTVCSDGTLTQTLTASATGGTITWYDAATGGNVVASPTQVGVGSSTYYAESFNGTCSSLTRTAVILTINPVPNAPISGGDQTVCSDGSLTQTLTATATGGTITWYDAATNGNVVTPTQVGVGTSTYYAEASDGTCSSLTRTAVTLTINPLPATATLNVVQPNCTTATGSITVTAPAGIGFEYNIGNGFQSSPVFSPLSAATYSITVKNNFGCTSLVPAVATINPQPFVPGAPVVNGIVNVCPYIGTNDLLTYTASVPGATSYNWILPPNVTLQSGAGTGSITVTIGAGFTSNQPNKQIRVTAVSECGVSAQTIFYLVAQFPSTPGAISGPINVCALIGTPNTATYTISKVVAATSYAWTVPANTSVTHPNGPGVNDTVIVVAFASNYASSSITVAAVNGCGTSGSVRSLSIPRIAASTPGLITGPTNVCAYIAPNGGEATYTILAVPGATSYSWSTPPGSQITHVNGPGVNDTIIAVRYPANFASGSVSVSASNGCGTSATRSLAITKLNPATPSVIDVIQTGFCPNREYSYTIANMPANATSIQWTIPTGQGAVLVSQTATSITVSYPGTAVNGTVTVRSFNNCGSSTTRVTTVKLPACPPDEPGEKHIATTTAPVKVSKPATTTVTTEAMDVRVFPNPTVSSFNLQVLTNAKATINVRVLDMQGRELSRLTVMPNQTTSIGSNLKAGSYIVETRQGTEVKTTKLIKF